MRVHYEKIVSGAHSFAVREFRSRVFTAPFHFHPEYELTVVLAGRGRRFAGDSVEDFGPGDLALIGANLPHRWASTAPAAGKPQSRSLVLQFRRDCLGGAFFAAYELAAVSRLLDRAHRGLHFTGRVVEQAGTALAALRDSTGAARIAGLVMLLERLEAEKSRMLASASYRTEMSDLSARRIDRVISFVEENYSDESLTLADAASIASLTPSAFRRFFARSVGRTFVSFVNETRVSHACRLLTETDEPVTSICFACGFGTISNFNQRFRNAKSQSPREYREGFQEQARGMPARFTLRT